MPIKKILMETIRVAFEKSRRVFRNVFTSGTFDKYRDDSGVYLKFLMVNAIGIGAGVFMLGYGILDIVRGVQPVGWIITGIGVMALVNFLFLRATENYIFASWVATLILTFSFMFLLSTGGGGNTGPLWIYTLPGVAMILLGIKAGSWLFSGFILYAGFVLFLPDSPLLFTDYPHDFVIRFIPTIITVLIMVYIFEALRRLSHKNILEKNLELEDSLTRMKEAEGALSKSEDKFRNMAKLLPEVIFESDQQGKLTYVNNIAFEKFGYSEEDYNRGITALQVIAPDDRERAGENFERIMRGEKSGGNEYKALRKDGSEFFVVIYSSPIMSNNIPAGIRGIIADITMIKKAEEELQEYSEKLEERVDKRTVELKERIAELERFQDATVERELRIKELREEVERLQTQIHTDENTVGSTQIHTDRNTDIHR